MTDLEKKLLLCAIDQAQFHDWDDRLIDTICKNLVALNPLTGDKLHILSLSICQ